MVTQIQHTSRSDKSNPVTSNVDAYLPYSLSLSLCVFLCQGLSIARSSRRVTWHQAASNLTQQSETHTHTHSHSHTQPEGMFRCFRPVTEGVRGLHSPLRTDLYPAWPPHLPTCTCTVTHMEAWIKDTSPDTRTF